MIPIVPVFFGPNMKAFTGPLSAFCNLRSSSSRGNEARASPNHLTFFFEKRLIRFKSECYSELRVIANLGMEIERQMRTVERDVVFKGEFQLPAQGFGHGTQARPKHSVMNYEQVSAAFRAFLQSAAGEIHRRRNFRYLAGILQLQAVERILVILNFANPQIGIAITDDLVQSGHVMTLPRRGNFGSEFA